MKKKIIYIVILLNVLLFNGINAAEENTYARPYTDYTQPEYDQMLDQYSNESKADPRIRSSNKLCDSTSTRTDKYNSAGRLIQRTC
ncbi:hypothetical protein [Mycoplasma sp. P36-A1]|uniref:hypothetical protein n=1 Tax=Mycoplasma sp. P36-A1 TaxID=3252900 RepID=UPI003C306363